MKAATTGMNTHINSETTSLATCWKVTRKDGEVFGFTDFDRDLTVESIVYHAATGYTRSAIHTIANLAVDNLDIESAIDSEILNANDLRAGVWDGATVEIFLVNWSALNQGKVMLKRGTVGEIVLKDSVFRAELRGLTQALSQQIVELYTPDCRADLGDSRCKINLAALTVSGTITSVTDRRTFADTSREEDDAYWNGGLIIWGSGANTDRKMEVKSFIGGNFTLYLPMPDNIEVGDTYTLQPGCDKSFGMCKARYNNVKNFRGEPHVPGSDQILNYPDAK